MASDTPHAQPARHPRGHLLTEADAGPRVDAEAVAALPGRAAHPGLRGQACRPR